MDSLVQRLRALSRVEHDDFTIGEEAADELERLQRENAELRAQLPEGMKHCTIVFKECEKGHGRLTATNWVQHGCQVCEIEQQRSDAERWRCFRTLDWLDESIMAALNIDEARPETLDAAIDAAMKESK